MAEADTDAGSDTGLETDPFAAVMAEALRRNLGVAEMMRLETLKWEFLARAAPDQHHRFAYYAAAILARSGDERLTFAPPGSAAPVSPARPQRPRENRGITRATALIRARTWAARHRHALAISGALLMLAALTAAWVYRWWFADDEPLPPPTTPIELADRIGASVRRAANLTASYLLRPDAVWWWLAGAIVAAALCALVWRHLRRQRLRRDANANSQPLAAVAVRVGRNTLFADPALRGALRNLRRHRACPSDRIDVSASIRATLASGGLPQVRFGTRPQTPEYLVLSEREAPGDHLPEVAGALGDRLDQAAIVNARYEFYGDPSELRSVGRGESEHFETLEGVIGRHEGATMMVLMESADACPDSGAMPRWLEAAAATRSTPFLINPRDPRQWNRDERTLEDLGLASFPATIAGLGALAERIGRGDPEGRGGDEGRGGARASSGAEPDLAAYLSRHRTMLLSPAPPDPARIAAVIDNLERWLDAGAMDWLRTIALFPVITTGFTFFAGATLAEQTLVTHERFLALARLPWLRTGQMPDWLRKPLVNGFSQARLERATAVVHAYLMPPRGQVGARSDFLQLRRRAAEPKQRRKLMARLAAMDNPLSEDALMLGALGGAPPDALDIEVREDTLPPVPWHQRPSLRALVGALAGLIVLSFVHSPLRIEHVPDTSPPAPTASDTVEQQPQTGADGKPDTPEIAAGGSGAPTVPLPVTEASPAPAEPKPQDAVVPDQPSLYIQIPSAAQRAEAQILARQLAGFAIGGKPLAVHAIQVVSNGPRETQLRCFQSDTCKTAVVLALELARLSVNPQIKRFQASDFKWVSAKKPSQYELWIGTSQDAAAELSMAAAGSVSASLESKTQVQQQVQQQRQPQTPLQQQQVPNQAPQSKLPVVSRSWTFMCDYVGTSGLPASRIDQTISDLTGELRSRNVRSLILTGTGRRGATLSLASIGGEPDPMDLCRTYVVSRLQKALPGIAITDQGGDPVSTRAGRAIKVTAIYDQANE